MIVGLIIACEIGFWVLIALGLIARYVLRRPRLGAVLLVLTPVVDLVLLLAVGVDLRTGGDATRAHAIAAIYLGFSIVYGHRMIRWADAWFAYRFADGPRPVRLYGAAYAKACWLGVVRTALAVGIAAGVLVLLIAIAAPGADTDALAATYRVLAIILGAETVWAASYTIWPKREPARVTSEAGRASEA